MSKFRVHRACTISAAIVAAVLLCAPPAWSQLLYGSIVGNIKDPSDAAVAGARVSITEKQTAQVREATTNDSGSFSFPTLTPGVYELRVQKDGFRSATQSTVNVTINSVTRVDIGMQLGAVAESIQVTAATAALQTDRAEVRSEMTARTFVNLPVSTGRNYQQLFRTLPGFRPPSNAHSVPTNPSRALAFNVNGTSQSINNTRIDGASSTAPWLPHIVGFVPTLESIDTVNVVTNSFDAEQGLAGGAAINVSIKSGTNEIHGSGFGYYTGNRLKAKNFFLPAGQQNPKLVVNEFGGTIGGPIKKDRLFYFVSYEGTYNREFASRFGTVPTAAMKRGDFSESPRGLWDPATGDGNGVGRIPIPNKIIPAARFSPITSKLVALTPDPNQPGLTNNFFAGGGYQFDRNRVDSKVNFVATDKLTMFGRFSMLHYDMLNPQMFGALGGPEVSSAGGNPGKGWGNTFSFTGAATYVIKPTLILDAYYGYTRIDTAIEQARLEEKLGTDFLGIPGTNGSRAFEGGWPQFNVDSYTALGVPNAFQPYYRRDPQYQYVSNFNWTKGSHEIRFGGDFYETHMNHLQPEAPGAFFGAQGGFSFSGNTTILRALNANGTLGGSVEAPNQFNSYASFLLGLPRTAGKITQVPDEYTTHSFQYSLYLRDRWNVNRKLTLSYGVRWEYFPFPTRAERGLEVYDPINNKMRVCGVGIVPRDCGIRESKRMFAPRIGFAYRVNDGFVLRAGYGITNDPFSHARTFRTNYPILLIDNLQGPNDYVPYDPRGIAAGIPPVRIPDLGNGIIDIPGTFAAFTINSPFRRGYVQSWNFTLQKQLPAGFVGQAGYVATRSTKAMGWQDLNAGQVINAGNAGRPLNRFGRNSATTIPEPFGNTLYDSLQATLERRFAQGMQLNMAYTWSKTIGFQDNNDSGPAIRALAFFDRNRTVRGYDRPHNVQISQVWELPFGKGKKFAQDGVAAAVVGGWQVNNILSFFSGTPFSVRSNSALNMPGSAQTADQIKPEVAKVGGVGRGTPFFDVDAFAPVTQARFGNMAENAMRGPSYANWDFSIFRRFQVNERWRIEFRGEAFNFTNTPHFNNPGANVSSYNPAITNPLTRYGGFGEILSTFNGVGRDGIDERQFRLGLRLAW